MNGKSKATTIGAGAAIGLALGGFQLYNMLQSYWQSGYELRQRIDRLEMRVCDIDPETRWWRGECVLRDGD